MFAAEPARPIFDDNAPTGSIATRKTAWYEDADSALATCNISMPLPGRSSLPIGAQSSSSAKPAQARACYNCRRRRLRCDRSIPSCRKCSASGEECLGYGTVLRWANAPALRGRLAPGAAGELMVQSPGRGRAKPLELSSASEDESGPRLSIHTALNPLLHHLSSRARHYVHHFSTAVCQDLVSFDRHDQNPFRAIIPLAEKFDFLQAIIVATGAMHLAALHGFENKPGKPALVDALVAKDKAIKLLRVAVDEVTPATQPMVLAGTVFLINLELIDSGKGGWQAHMAAASTLMSALHGPVHKLDQSLMACVDAIAADCLTYRVLGSATSGVSMASWAESDLADFFSVLKRAEAYSYQCCPPEILQILLSASRLCSKSVSSCQSRAEGALALLYQARSLDVAEWVHSIRGLSAKDDLDIRVSIALAHRATACLYILLAVPEAAPSPALVDMLVQEVLGHLAAVPVDHIHLKATVWPTFMVGAQTDDPSQRAWCIARMQAVSSRNPWICPWGYIRTAMQTMQQLWEARDRDLLTDGRRNWLLELNSMRDKCLIV